MLIDKFSKIAIFMPCRKDTDAEEAAKLYLQHVYPCFGLPVKFISDRDARFTSRFWQTLMKLLKVDLGLTAAYHPSTDGQAEKMNQVMDIGLPGIQKIYKTSQVSSLSSNSSTTPPPI
jgi:transposase InsO family protein